ncbi:MAG TPA: ABC transporter permease [Tepidisphaeraceae bacterium]|jgi:spermidine/putrescine transport system permease protein|nr:ABC transporter permease [Tepidisphaeraceae bacterium]
MTNSSGSGNTFARQLLAAWTYAVLVFLYLPIVLLIIYSFNRSEFNAVWGGFTLHWYGEVWRDEELLGAFQNSLIIAAVVTVVSVILGTGSAWLMHRYRFPAARSITTLAVLPMVVPEIIMGVSLMLLFRCVRIELGFVTVIIAHVTFCFPFVMAAVQARLAGLDPSLQEAAMDLGATPAVAFFRVIVPYLLPGIIAGAMLAFTLSLDEFIVTFFTTSAASQTLPVVIYSRIKPGLKPTLNAASTLIVAVTVVLALAADAIRRRNRPA